MKKYRDGLFRDYFSDKRRLLDLCNLLTGEDATDPDEIEINTLDGIFFEGLKNDISCLFRGRFLVIIEHQSTINENMPLRILFYAAELFRQYADKHRGKIYREELLTLPEPKFFVFYNGKKKEAERREMRLSEAFGKRTCLEVVVQLYNLNVGMNEEFISAKKSLENYCLFINLVEKFSTEGMDKAHALAAAFKYCINHGIMTEYLLDRKKELASMLALEYDPELARQAWIEKGIEEGIERGIKQGIERGIKQGIERGIKQGIERGIEQGIEQGVEQGHAEEKISMVKHLLRAKTPLEYIIAATGWTKEQIFELAKD